ncbi:hypothetical protein LAZ67_11001790 [Cordylochernes scorpioides]|uniref:Reverse transcriptase n=1 Tax=Cordylochernes scorpioides TaxID=51811 RepID=A0ABY6L0H1_9ARAC|nr:hypothetical protein LAZ67_11001790 [Cordylochernes scorpioides]
MENQARSDATSEGNTTPSIVTDIVAQLAAALRDIINPGQRDSDLPRYDGTYPAANFFQQYDDIAGRAYLTETKRLQKLPAQLSGEPLTFFRQLDLANKSYDQARQILIDLYPGTVEVSFSKFLALKLTPQTTLQGYYKEKTAMGLQLNLPTDIILESLTEGLPTADQRLVRTVSPNTLKDWHDLMARIKGSSVPAPARPTPEPTSSRHDGHITLAREQPSRPYNMPPRFFSTPRLPRHADSSVPSQPPSPCHYCRGNHWNAQCPRRQPSGRNNVFYQETTGRQPRTSPSTARSQPARSAPSSDTTVQTTPRSEEIGDSKLPFVILSLNTLSNFKLKIDLCNFLVFQNEAPLPPTVYHFSLVNDSCNYGKSLENSSKRASLATYQHNPSMHVSDTSRHGLSYMSPSHETISNCDFASPKKRVDMPQNNVFNDCIPNYTTNVCQIPASQSCSNSNIPLSFLDIINRYSHIFSSNKFDVPKLKIPPVKIHTLSDKIIALRPYRASLVDQREIQEQVNQMLKFGIIEPSFSPYASPVTLVTKKDKTKRFCVDFRKLNEIICPDVHPLPLIETVLDKLAHAKIFTNVDLSSAFWQVEIEPSSRNLLAFVTLEGQYQFSRLPFGLRNSPQIYERALSQVIQKYELDFIAHYFDDFVIFSNTIEEHAQHIQKFFLVCQEENIKLNYNKCEFFKTQIEFLGYTIKSGTYTPQIKNLDVINAIKVPTNLKTFQSFLGAINVYNKFIPNYAQLRTPLNKLLKKDTTWEWDNQCQTSFEALKESLTSQPILHLFKEGLPCQLYCDASLLGIAGVLKQQYPDGTLYPVQFYSRALRPHEKNYTISELECLAIIECVDKFRVYLTGVKFTIFTDHHALQWLKTIKNPTGRLFRWSLKMSTYEYEIRYIKGSKQHEADLLSRNPFCGFLSAAQIKEKQPLELPYPNATINPEGLHTLTRKGVTKVIVPPSLQHTLINKTHSINHSSSSSQILLSTALIRVNDLYGNSCMARALVDTGSQRTLITDSLRKTLNLPMNYSDASMYGIGDNCLEKPLGEVDITFSPHYSSMLFTAKALILNKITCNLPNFVMERTRWPHLVGLRLADPTFDKPAPIDIIIGADIAPSMYTGQIRFQNERGPTACNSKLGWLLSGKIMAQQSDGSLNHSVLTFCATFIDNQLKKFWELDSIPPCTQPIRTKEEMDCEQHFKTNVSRITTGRYQVRLPFRVTPNFGNSRRVAFKRFLSLENKLLKSEQLYSRYKLFMKEYSSLNIMQIISAVDIPKSPSQVYYMPHHCVLKEESTTTNLRVVFDASACSDDSPSLNKALHIGPKLQTDIFDLLLRFRTFFVALSADIEKMYRQILIHPDDSDYQRVLWRDSPSEAIQEYKLTTITYGTACAPYLAIRTLHQLADDEAMNYPVASEIVKRDFYVDDLLTGADTVEEAQVLIRQIIALLAEGGFPIRKWVSNSPKILDFLPKDQKGINQSFDFKDLPSVKLLGILWDPTLDSFTIRVRPPDIQVNSKRSLLSLIARIYDPLGWMAPLVIIFKIMLQKLWAKGCNWDERLPECIQRQWTGIEGDINQLNKISIPRYIPCRNSFLTLELHGFCDSSEKAYAAVICVKFCKHDGSIDISLIASKTKVAPIKALSLPRLELCSALLLANLFVAVKESLSLHFDQIFLWSDSTIALNWLKSESKRWKTFVTNRVSTIQRKTPPHSWFHVPGSENPADLATRGLTPAQLVDNQLWWQGPHWLQDSSVESYVDLPPSDDLSPETLIEERSTILVYHSIMGPMPELLLKYSSWIRTVDVMAFCLRFISNCKSTNKSLNRFLSALEIHNATVKVIILIQNQDFIQEIGWLRNKGFVSGKSNLRFLNPFLDADGILRVGGRLQHSNLDSNRKHPIILPKRHHCTDLIIEHYHKQSLHSGLQTTLSMISQKYWIISCKAVVKRVLNRCITCFKHRSKTVTQIMAIPDEVVDDLSHISRWKCIQSMKNSFWKKWSQDYLNLLQARPRWHRTHQDLQSGQLVLMKQDSTPPHHWPLARIIKTYKGPDGHVRVVDLRTPKNVLKRPITKIAPLPFKE